MIVLATGVLFVGDALETAEIAGVLILGLGIALMAAGVFSDGESLRLLPYAFGAAVATASYSVLDGMGARVAGDAGAFVAWMFVLDGVIFAAVMSALRGRAAWPVQPAVWGLGSLGAAASYASYAIVVWAMTPGADRACGGLARDLGRLRDADRLADLSRADDAAQGDRDRPHPCGRCGNAALGLWRAAGA